MRRWALVGAGALGVLAMTGCRHDTVSDGWMTTHRVMFRETHSAFIVGADPPSGVVVCEFDLRGYGTSSTRSDALIVEVMPRAYEDDWRPAVSFEVDRSPGHMFIVSRKGTVTSYDLPRAAFDDLVTRLRRGDAFAQDLITLIRERSTGSRLVPLVDE